MRGASQVTSRVLITGAEGFVAPYVIDALREAFGEDVEIVPTAKAGGRDPRLGALEELDVTDAVRVHEVIKRQRPSHVIHLAGIAAVTNAAANVDLAWDVHVRGTRNLALALLQHQPECWLINVGSGLVYGETANAVAALDETALLAPMDDYGASKAAADLALGVLARQGLKVLRLRPFNHTGAGQSEAFIVPAFAMQVARIEVGLQEAVIHVGNLDAERDFLDVRDVARAYAFAVMKTDELQSGLILNIASGQAVKIRTVLDTLLSRSSLAIAVKTDPARLRPSDVPRIVGKASRARALLGWELRYPFDETLQSVLEFCRAQVRR